MKNKNIEFVRAIAIIYMVIYHYTLLIFNDKITYQYSLIVESLGQIALISFL